MARTFVRPQAQIKKTNTYDDTKAAGDSLETVQSQLADDLNALRSQYKRFIWADESGNWYDDIPTHTAKKRALDKLNEDLDDIEVKKFLVDHANLIDVTVSSGTKASGTLTLTGQPEEGHEAEGILGFTGNANDSDTVTIGSKTYSFQDTLTDVDGNVKIGASASATIDNLVAAINLGAGAGTAYATSMTANDDVTAATEFGDSMRVTSILKGPDANEVATTETGDNLVWRDATLVNATNAKRAEGILTLASNFLGEIAATGTLTASGNPSGGVQATQTFTLTDNPSDARKAVAFVYSGYDGSPANEYVDNFDSVTIDSNVFRWYQDVSSYTYTVLKGASFASFDNMKRAINREATVNVNYSSDCPDISADYTATLTNIITAFTTNTVYQRVLKIEANAAGSAGNVDISVSGTNVHLLTPEDGSITKASRLSGGKDEDTVTIDSKTYTFQDTLTNVDGHVKIGATASDTLDNLIAAINLGSGSGTAYAAATTLHPTVSAAAGTGDTMDITAKTGGTGGNSITVSRDCSVGEWTENTLTGGDVGVAATGNVTFSANVDYGTRAFGAIIFGSTSSTPTNATYSGPQDNEQLTIDGKTYTFHSQATSTYDASDGYIYPLNYGFNCSFNLTKALAAYTPISGAYSSGTSAHTTVRGRIISQNNSRGLIQLRSMLPGHAGDEIDYSNDSCANTDEFLTGASPNLAGGEVGDTITIDGKTYYFVNQPISTIDQTDADGLVYVGSSLSDTISNLVAAINLSGVGTGPNYKYSLGMTVHSTVSASVGAGNSIDLTAKSTGTGGNSITVTTNDMNMSYGTVYMSGGAAGDTVTMDSKTYTFQDTLTDVNGNVKVGATASDSLDNLIAAVNLDAGAGTKYAASMTLHSTMSAAAGAGDTMDVTAKTAGTVGNSLDTTETGDNLSWGGSTLSGGANGETITIDSKVYTMTNSLTDVDGRVLVGATSNDSINNLIAAIGLLPGANSLYANSMTIHPTCLAENGTGASMDVSAKAGGTAGNSIATTETASTASWGNSTLSGGLAEETVTIDTKTYTFQSSLTDSDGNVKIGSDVDTTISNLVNAIILGPGTGTAYADSMTEHSTVTAAEGAGDTMTAAAKTAGTAGNSIATTETLANGSWGNSTLSGGTAGPGGEVNFVVLSKAAGEVPNLTAAIGTVLTEGMVVAYNASFGSHSLAEVTGQNAISPKNLCAIRDSTTGQRLLSGGKTIFALLQCEDNTDGHTFDDSTKRAMLSFVRMDATGDDLEACPAADIDGETVIFSYTERTNYSSADEAAFLNDQYVSIAVPGVDVNLDACIDNQSGAASQAQDIDVDIFDTKAWAFRDSASVDLFRIYGNAGSGTSAVEVGAAVDIYDNDAADVDFHNGIAVGSSGTEIAINETAGVIERAADLILRSSGAGELYLDDGNQPGSWAQTDGIKLSENATEWSDFETEFGGESSLLKAITQASNASARTTGTAVLQADVLANNDVDATTTSNLDVDLPDYSGVSSFVEDVDVFLNGKLLNNGADAAANEDVYPGSTPSQGMLKFEFDLDGTSPNPDVLSMIVWGQ